MEDLKTSNEKKNEENPNMIEEEKRLMMNGHLFSISLSLWNWITSTHCFVLSKQIWMKSENENEFYLTESY